MTATAKVLISSKGQLSIPRRMRDAMGLGKGSEVTLLLHADGRLEIAAARTSISDIFGLLARPGEKAMSIAEMEKSIDEEMAKEIAL